MSLLLWRPLSTTTCGSWNCNPKVQSHVDFNRHQCFLNWLKLFGRNQFPYQFHKTLRTGVVRLCTIECGAPPRFLELSDFAQDFREMRGSLRIARKEQLVRVEPACLKRVIDAAAAATGHGRIHQPTLLLHKAYDLQTRA